MRALRAMDALGGLLSLVGCLLALSAWPSVALADNCSDPPRLQSDGTWSAPGPDCQRTNGYQDGGKLAGNIVRGGAVAIFGVFATNFLINKGQIKVVSRPDGSQVHVIVPGSPLDRYVRGDRSQAVLDQIRALHPKGVNVGVYRPSGVGPDHPVGPGRDGKPITRTERIDGKDVLVLTPGTAVQVQLGARPMTPSAPTPPVPAPPAPTPPVISVPPAGPTTTTPPPAGGGPSGGPSGGADGGGLLPPGGPGDSSLTRPSPTETTRPAPGTDGGAGTQPKPQPSDPAAGGRPAPADAPPSQAGGGGLLGVEGGPGGGPGDSGLTRPSPGGSAGPGGPSGPSGPGGPDAGGPGAGGPGAGGQGAGGANTGGADRPSVETGPSPRGEAQPAAESPAAGGGSGGAVPPKAGAADSPPQLASDGRGGSAPAAPGDTPPATGGDGPAQPGGGAASTTSSTTSTASSPSTTSTASSPSTTSTSSTPSTTSAGGDAGGGASTAGQDPSSGPATSTSNTTSSATGQQPQPLNSGEKAADAVDNLADARENKNTNLKPAQPTQPGGRAGGSGIPPQAQTLLEGGEAAFDVSKWHDKKGEFDPDRWAQDWQQGGKYPLPQDAGTFAQLLSGGTVTGKDGTLVVSQGGEAHIVAVDGKVVARPGPDQFFRENDIAAGALNEGLKVVNDNLAKNGIRVESITVDAKGQLRIKTSKIQ